VDAQSPQILWVFARTRAAARTRTDAHQAASVDLGGTRNHPPVWSTRRASDDIWGRDADITQVGWINSTLRREQFWAGTLSQISGSCARTRDVRCRPGTITWILGS
jgi:hypothetical protein